MAIARIARYTAGVTLDAFLADTSRSSEVEAQHSYVGSSSSRDPTTMVLQRVGSRKRSTQPTGEQTEQIAPLITSHRNAL
jgi:hypothetical protein